METSSFVNVILIAAIFAGVWSAWASIRSSRANSKIIEPSENEKTAALDAADAEWAKFRISFQFIVRTLAFLCVTKLAFDTLDSKPIWTSTDIGHTILFIACAGLACFFPEGYRFFAIRADRFVKLKASKEFATQDASATDQAQRITALKAELAELKKHQ